MIVPQEQAVDATGWALKVAGEVSVTDEPTAEELAALTALEVA